MTGKDSKPKCALVIIADGFEETEALVVLCALRQARIYAKSVGLVSGLICGSHGILVMPDLTLAELDGAVDTSNINLAVLPGGDHHLANLEPDPRIHRLLRQVADQDGWILTNTQGMRVLKNAGLANPETGDGKVRLHSIDQPVEAIIQDLVRRFGPQG